MYRLLAVDDEPFITEGLKHIIDWEEYGIELTGTASNGVEALELIKSLGADILITDIKMPKMSGLELIQRVKKIAPNTRFIVLSGYDDFEYLKESIKLGIENYLLKPVNCEELEETIINVRNKIEAQAIQKSYSDKDVDIIRNNILYRWATGSINQLELVERAAFLDIPLEASKYVVCILRLFINPPVEQALMQKAQELCSELKSFGQGLGFCTPENNMVFIMGGLEEAFKLAEQYTNNFKEIPDIKYFFTIGSEENDYNFVSRSYFNAMELQRYSLVMPCNSVLEYNSFIKNDHMEETARRLMELSREKGESINPIIKRILDYVKINYSKDISLKILANDLNTNANYLGQLFKEETNEHFSDYLNIIRINKAKELLKNTVRSTKDISDAVGYRDVNYFYKTFKKYSGVSPSDFRNI